MAVLGYAGSDGYARRRRRTYKSILYIYTYTHAHIDCHCLDIYVDDNEN